MFWGKVAWCPCASTNIKEMTIGVNVGYSSEVLCVTLQSQNWCFHLVSASFLETAWLFSSRALLRNDWAVMTFLKICSFFFDSKKHLMKNKLNTSENYSLCGQEELKSHSSLVLPEGTSFPLHVAKSFCVQNLSEIPFSCCTHTTQLLQSRQAHCIRQMQMQPVLPLGASSLVSVGGICCVTSFGNLFFFPVVPCFWGSCAAHGSEISICMVLCSCIPHRGCRSTVLPWIRRAAESQINSGKSLVSHDVLFYE